MAPVGAVVDVRFKVPPEQRGLLLPAKGVGGGEGLVRIKGPKLFDIHPFNVTLILV
jgi:hypothetical protein